MRDELKQYIELFESEAKEYLQGLSNNIVKLEKTPEDQDLLYEIMRAAHTLKGMTATMEYKKMSNLCHKMEDFFDMARKGEIMVDKKIVDAVLKCIDRLDEGVKKVVKGEEEPETDDLASEIEKILKNSEGKEVAAKPESPEKTEKKDVAKYKEEKIKEINVSTERLDKLMSLMEEMITVKMNFNEIEKNATYDKLRNELNNFERLTNDLQYQITQARMVEVGYLFQRFPRMVRDVASESEKEIEFKVEGNEIKLDRNIIDELGEPLVHLIRNAIDHGIEKKGELKLSARREKDAVFIEVEDTGNGLDIERIKQKALENGLITEEKLPELTEQEVINFIFDPELSTSEKVTDVSGRGVGMAAVKSKIEALNGSIITQTKAGEGTKFSLKLPLTLAIIKALLVKVKDQNYAIPVMNIDRSIDLKSEQIKKAADQKVAIIDEDDVPLVRLSSHFNLSQEQENQKHLAVIVERANGRMGLLVDELIDEMEIVVKPLSSFCKSKKEFAGVTVLGDGSAVLILDIDNLI